MTAGGGRQGGRQHTPRHPPPLAGRWRTGPGGAGTNHRLAGAGLHYQLVACNAAPAIKVKLHYAYKVRNIGRVRPRLRFCVLC